MGRGAGEGVARLIDTAFEVEDAGEAIRQLVADAPAGALVGAGTVLTEADVDSLIASTRALMQQTLDELAASTP